MRLDVTDDNAVKRAFEAANAQCGPVSLLVASHGIRGAFVPAVQLDLDRVRRVLDVHIVGTLVVANALARSVRATGNGGSIVTVSLTTAYRGWARQADYGVAKAGVRQLTENLAIEWARWGIRVNSVAPGHTLTPMVQGMLESGYDLSEVEARTPLGRLASPDEQARCVEHLLLDATFVTGVCLPVDGGWTTVGK